MKFNRSNKSLEPTAERSYLLGCSRLSAAAQLNCYAAHVIRRNVVARLSIKVQYHLNRRISCKLWVSTYEQ